MIAAPPVRIPPSSPLPPASSRPSRQPSAVATRSNAAAQAVQAALTPRGSSQGGRTGLFGTSLPAIFGGLCQGGIEGANAVARSIKEGKKAKRQEEAKVASARRGARRATKELDLDTFMSNPYSPLETIGDQEEMDVSPTDFLPPSPPPPPPPRPSGFIEASGRSAAQVAAQQSSRDARSRARVQRGFSPQQNRARKITPRRDGGGGGGGQEQQRREGQQQQQHGGGGFQQQQQAGGGGFQQQQQMGGGEQQQHQMGGGPPRPPSSPFSSSPLRRVVIEVFRDLLEGANGDLGHADSLADEILGSHGEGWAAFGIGLDFAGSCLPPECLGHIKMLFRERVGGGHVMRELGDDNEDDYGSDDPISLPLPPPPPPLPPLLPPPSSSSSLGSPGSLASHPPVDPPICEGGQGGQ